MLSQNHIQQSDYHRERQTEYCNGNWQKMSYVQEKRDSALDSTGEEQVDQAVMEVYIETSLAQIEVLND